MDRALLQDAHGHQVANAADHAVQAARPGPVAVDDARLRRLPRHLVLRAAEPPQRLHRRRRQRAVGRLPTRRPGESLPHPRRPRRDARAVVPVHQHFVLLRRRVHVVETRLVGLEPGHHRQPHPGLRRDPRTLVYHRRRARTGPVLPHDDGEEAHPQQILRPHGRRRRAHGPLLHLAQHDDRLPEPPVVHGVSLRPLLHRRLGHDAHRPRVVPRLHPARRRVHRLRSRREAAGSLVLLRRRAGRRLRDRDGAARDAPLRPGPQHPHQLGTSASRPPPVSPPLCPHLSVSHLCLTCVPASLPHHRRRTSASI